MSEEMIEPAMSEDVVLPKLKISFGTSGEKWIATNMPGTIQAAPTHAAWYVPESKLDAALRENREKDAEIKILRECEIHRKELIAELTTLRERVNRKDGVLRGFVVTLSHDHPKMLRIDHDELRRLLGLAHAALTPSDTTQEGK